MITREGNNSDFCCWIFRNSIAQKHFTFVEIWSCRWSCWDVILSFIWMWRVVIAVLYICRDVMLSYTFVVEPVEAWLHSCSIFSDVCTFLFYLSVYDFIRQLNLSGCDCIVLSCSLCRDVIELYFFVLSLGMWLHGTFLFCLAGWSWTCRDGITFLFQLSGCNVIYCIVEPVQMWWSSFSLRRDEMLYILICREVITDFVQLGRDMMLGYYHRVFLDKIVYFVNNCFLIHLK